MSLSKGQSRNGPHTHPLHRKLCSARCVISSMQTKRVPQRPGLPSANLSANHMPTPLSCYRASQLIRSADPVASLQLCSQTIECRLRACFSVCRSSRDASPRGRRLENQSELLGGKELCPLGHQPALAAISFVRRSGVLHWCRLTSLLTLYGVARGQSTSLFTTAGFGERHVSRAPREGFQSQSRRL